MSEQEEAGVTIDRAVQYAAGQFNEDPAVAVDRVSRLGDWSYRVDTNSRAHLENPTDRSTITIGNGPVVILKATGEIFRFGSNPMMGNVFSSQSEEEFRANLAEINFPTTSTEVIQPIENQ